MRTLFWICSLIYRVLIALLVPLIIIGKSIAFNKNYYPISHIMFIAFLVVTFLSLTIQQMASERNTLLKRILSYTSIFLVLISLILQLYFLLDLYPHIEKSVSDIFFLSFYILFHFVTIIHLIGLFKKYIRPYFD